MCGAVLSGAGLFPWLIGSISKALHWVWAPNSVTQYPAH